MKTEANRRINTLLIQMREICNSLLFNNYTLGNDVDVETIISLTYSPKTDVVYRQLYKLLYVDNEINLKGITTDTISNMFIIELEFGDVDNISLNYSQDAEFKSITNDIIL